MIKKVEDSVQQIHHIINDTQYYSFIHGARNNDEIEAIIEEGLYFDEIPLANTSLNLVGVDQKLLYGLLTHWPHLERKNFVILQFDKNWCRNNQGAVWYKRQDGHTKNDKIARYLLFKELVRAIFSLSNWELIMNQDFKGLVENEEGLIQDQTLIKIMAKPEFKKSLY